MQIYISGGRGVAGGRGDLGGGVCMPSAYCTITWRWQMTTPPNWNYAYLYLAHYAQRLAAPNWAPNDNLAGNSKIHKTH